MGAPSSAPNAPLPGALYADVVAPAATGNATLDTANLQAAINKTPANGWLSIPRGAYNLNASLSITKNLRITGAGVFDILTGANLPDIPWAAPYLAGTVFNQTAANTDCVQITGSLLIVHLSDFGITFDPSIMFATTGHGINASGTPVGGQTYHTSGLVKSTWRNISVFGHDGNHYGFYFLNPMILTLDTLKAVGGGIMSFVADNPAVNYGNVVAIHPYGVLMCAGSADAYHLQGAGSGSFGLMNLMTFIRPQVNAESPSAHFTSATPPAAPQALWNTVNSAYVRDIEVVSPDFENDIGGVTLPITFNTATYVTPAGGIMSTTAYLERAPYNRNVARPTVTVSATAGTGATASVYNGNGGGSTDMSGTVILSTGTGTPYNDMFTVTFGTPLLQVPKFIIVTLTYTASSITQQFTCHTFSTTGFTVQANGSNPQASVQYQVSWLVVQ